LDLKIRSTGECPCTELFTSFLFERANQFSAFSPGVRPTANAVGQGRLERSGKRHLHPLVICLIL
jgi:hypothetical protein